MPRPHPRILHASISLFALGCSSMCGEPDEDARIRRELDTTKVHLYVALKLALEPDTEDPDVLRVQVAVLDALTHAYRLARSTGSEGDAAEPPERQAVDALRLAQALWTLRGQGKRAVEERRSTTPILPRVAAMAQSAEPLTQLSADDEHALLMLVYWALKLDESVPTPIPPEIVLYEAWMLEPEGIRLSGLVPLSRAARANIYGRRGLCGMASREADALAAMDPASALRGIRELPGQLGGDPVDEAGAIEVWRAARAIGQGEAGLCWLERSEHERAAPHVEAFLDVCVELGVPPAELALARAYVAYHQRDYPALRRHLELARTSPHLSRHEQAAIDDALAHFSGDEPPPLRSLFDGAFFATLVARVALSQALELTSREDVRQIRIIVAIRALTVQAGQLVDRGADLAGGAEQAGRGAFRWLTDLIGGDPGEGAVD